MHLQHHIASQLEKHGFTISFGPRLAEKSYDTAVGAKLATIWLSAPNPAAGQMTLSGYYFSEGRNILQSCAQLIEADATPAQCTSAVEQFASQVELAVCASYAVRMHRALAPEPHFPVEPVQASIARAAASA